MDEKIEFTDTIQPIALPKTDIGLQNSTNEIVKVVGWGRTTSEYSIYM